MSCRQEEQIARLSEAPTQWLEQADSVIFAAQQLVRRSPNCVRGMVNPHSSSHSTSYVGEMGLWISRTAILVVRRMASTPLLQPYRPNGIQLARQQRKRITREPTGCFGIKREPGWHRTNSDDAKCAAMGSASSIGRRSGITR